MNFKWGKKSVLFQVDSVTIDVCLRGNHRIEDLNALTKDFLSTHALVA